MKNYYLILSLLFIFFSCDHSENIYDETAQDSISLIYEEKKFILQI